MNLKTLQNKKLNIISLFLMLTFILMACFSVSYNETFAIIFYVLTLCFVVLYGLSRPRKENIKDWKIKYYEELISDFYNRTSYLLEQSKNNKISVTDFEYETESTLKVIKDCKDKIFYFEK